MIVWDIDLYGRIETSNGLIHVDLVDAAVEDYEVAVRHFETDAAFVRGDRLARSDR